MSDFSKRHGLGMISSLQSALANLQPASSVLGPYTALVEQLSTRDFRGHQILGASQLASFFRDQEFSGSSMLKAIDLTPQITARSASFDRSSVFFRLNDISPMLKSVSALLAQQHLRESGVGLSWARTLDRNALAIITDRSPLGIGSVLKETAIHSQVAAAFLSPVTTTGIAADQAAVRLLGFSFSTFEGLASISPTRKQVAGVVDSLLSLLDDLVENVTAEPGPDSDVPDEPDTSGIEDTERPTRQRPPLIWTPAKRDLDTTERHLALAPIHVFLGASYKDTEHREALISHLTALLATNEITLWSDADTQPGEDSDSALAHNLQLARIVLLLLSADYLRELYTRGQMHAFRAASKRAVIVPVFVRAVDTTGLWLADLSALPTDGMSVATARDRDDAWYKIAISIRQRVEQLRAASKSLLH